MIYHVWKLDPENGRFYERQPGAFNSRATAHRYGKDWIGGKVMVLECKEADPCDLCRPVGEELPAMSSRSEADADLEEQLHLVTLERDLWEKVAKEALPRVK